MSSYSDAEHRAFKLFPETCPILEGILNELRSSRIDQFEGDLNYASNQIKDKITVPFREALTKVLVELGETENKYEDQKHYIKDLERNIEELNNTISDLRSDVERLGDQLFDATAVPQESGN